MAFGCHSLVEPSFAFILYSDCRAFLVALCRAYEVGDLGSWGHLIFASDTDADRDAGAATRNFGSYAVNGPLISVGS